jgi:hypothetical protein
MLEAVESIVSSRSLLLHVIAERGKEMHMSGTFAPVDGTAEHFRLTWSDSVKGRVRWKTSLCGLYDSMHNSGGQAQRRELLTQLIFALSCQRSTAC